MVILSFIIILIICIAIRKEKILNFSTFFLASILYMICYGIVPLVIFVVDIPSFYSGPLGAVAYSAESNKYLFYYASVVALLGYIIFYMAYNFAIFKSKVLFSNYLFTLRGLRKLYSIAKLFLIVGFVFLVLYIAIYGSIVKMLLGNTRMAYGGEAEVQVESPFLFLIILAKIAIFSTYLLWGIKKIDKTKARIYFYISLIVSLFLLFRFSGRMILMTFIGTFALSSFIVKQKLPKLKLVVLSGVTGFILLFGKSLFKSILYEDAFSRRQEYYASGGGWMTPFLDIIGSFSFPYSNLLYNFGQNNNQDFLYFRDILQAPLYIIPRKIIPIDTVDTTIEVNTMNILGIKGGIIPPDIITYGYLNAGLLGVVLVSIFFGILCKYIDSFKRNGAPAVSVIITIALIFIVGFRVMYFNPKQLVVGSFYFFVGLFILRIFTPKKKSSNFI